MPIRQFDAESFTPSKAILEIVMYVRSNGSCPAIDSIEKFEDPIRRKVLSRLVNFAMHGLNVARSQSRVVRTGMYELKHPPEIRVLWAGYGKNRIVVLSANKKPSNTKAQTRQIDQAVTWFNQLRSE
ncbi:MAG: type II toxin-antitoxin system RelE/ParE family toxin [Chloroflexi bacterium]|nr:type II toxin-antitoxin system RelE/ParE family toxin [Chloroflexota bacterium]